jgi:hypothetical protein
MSRGLTAKIIAVVMSSLLVGAAAAASTTDKLGSPLIYFGLAGLSVLVAEIVARRQPPR